MAKCESKPLLPDFDPAAVRRLESSDLRERDAATISILRQAEGRGWGAADPSQLRLGLRRRSVVSAVRFSDGSVAVTRHDSDGGLVSVRLRFGRAAPVRPGETPAS
jgi:hypothetical protein